MKLFTCPAKTIGGSIGHPCGAAALALDEAGLDYEIETVGGFKNIPFTTGGGKRDKLIELTGKPDAPVLLLPDGQWVSGSRQIVAWAKAYPAT